MAAEPDAAKLDAFVADLEALNLARETKRVTGRLAAPGTSPILRFLKAKTGGMREADLEFLPAPERPDRYVADSFVLRIKGLQVEIIDRPLSTLTPILATVFLDLNRLIYKGSDLRPGPYMPHHLETATSLAIARRGEEIVGYSMVSHLRVGDDLVLLHNATVVDQAARGRGLTFLLNAVHFARAFWASGLRPYYSTARTQNPLVYGEALSTGPYYPRPGEAPPEDIRRVGAAVAEALDPAATFDADVLVQRNAWKKPSEGLPSRHHRDDVNEYCDRHLDYARGDGIIVVGRFTLREVARVIWRFVWKQLDTRSPVRRSSQPGA